MTTPRQQLAAQQHQLLQSLLTSNAPAPLQHAAKTLTAKRRRELTLAIPDLAEALAEDFPKLFTQFAAKNAYPNHGGPKADARNFARWLLKTQPLEPAITKIALLSQSSPHILLRALRALRG